MSHLSKQTKVVGSACNRSMSRARSQEKNVMIPHLHKQTRVGGIHVMNQQIELRANNEMHKQNQEHKHLEE
jgi:hypothetical protein